MDIKFTRCGTRPDGELLYRMEIDGRTAAEGLTLDEVIAAINRRDEEKLGEEHAPRTCPSQSAAPTALPSGASQGREQGTFPLSVGCADSKLGMSRAARASECSPRRGEPRGKRRR